MKRAIAMLLFVGFMSAGRLDPELLAKWKDIPDSRTLSVLVIMKEKPDFSAIPQNERIVRLRYLKDFARRSQQGILEFLETQKGEGVQEYRTFWIFNGLYIKATKRIIEDILIINIHFA